jgi:hypothetical protein
VTINWHSAVFCFCHQSLLTKRPRGLACEEYEEGERRNYDQSRVLRKRSKWRRSSRRRLSQRRLHATPTPYPLHTHKLYLNNIRSLRLEQCSSTSLQHTFHYGESPKVPLSRRVTCSQGNHIMLTLVLRCCVSEYVRRGGQRGFELSKADIQLNIVSVVISHLVERMQHLHYKYLTAKFVLERKKIRCFLDNSHKPEYYFRA